MKKRGFTLVEIIISIAILSFVSAIILKLFISADGINRRAKEKSFASIYCSNAIEEHESDTINKATIYRYYYDDNWSKIEDSTASHYSVIVTIEPSEQNSALLNIRAEVQNEAGAAILTHKLTTLNRHSGVLIW